MDCLVDKMQFGGKALLIGERIDVRSLAKAPQFDLPRLATAPLTVLTESGGVVVLFRYGVVVLFDVVAKEEAALFERLAAFVSSPLIKSEVEELSLRVDSTASEGVEGGVIVLHGHDVERLQVVAENAGKSVVLGWYEARVADSFDRIEPFALEIGVTGRTRQQARELLRHLGTALLSQQQMVGRVQPAEKPDVLWERPDLELLNVRVADEFEIRDRNVVLERKLDLIARTTQILLDLVQDRRTLRVEWYVVLLIVLEIFLTVFQMALWRR